MNKPLHFDQKYLLQIFESIHDGIIIMDQNRKIVLMNPAAETLTGWKLDGSVPYCSFCENRSLKPGEGKCYLIDREEVPYFLSEMPTYHGERLNVEMSTALIYTDHSNDQKEYLLVLRDQELKQKEEEARLSKVMLQKLIEAKETEHRRLAQELHDGVGQSLYTISIALQAIERFVKEPKLEEYLDEVRKELDKVMGDIKSYSYQLRPQSLDNLGLSATIKGIIQVLEKSHPSLTIEFFSDIHQRLPSLVEINMYRVIQEALHNISKYAEATSVMLYIIEQKNNIIFKICDDGTGFDVKARKQEGLGLMHMKERVNQLGGTLHITSKKGIGTTIEGEIPLSDSDAY